MRALIIGDSHCRDLDVALLYNCPSIQTYTVFAPSNLTAILGRYVQELANINNFQPDILFLHLGHNDLAFHHHLNPNPTHPRTVALNNIQFAQMIHFNHPGIRIYISAIYPRSSTATSYLSYAATVSYNRKVKRFGQHLRTLTNAAGFHILLNNIMWRRISKAMEESSHFLADGLHLSFEAKIIITREWLNQATTI
jgi:lysophospholipase L1-like esterase